MAKQRLLRVFQIFLLPVLAVSGRFSTVFRKILCTLRSFCEVLDNRKPSFREDRLKCFDFSKTNITTLVCTPPCLTFFVFLAYPDVTLTLSDLQPLVFLATSSLVLLQTQASLPHHPAFPLHALPGSSFGMNRGVISTISTCSESVNCKNSARQEENRRHGSIRQFPKKEKNHFQNAVRCPLPLLCAETQ